MKLFNQKNHGLIMGITTSLIVLTSITSATSSKAQSAASSLVELTSTTVPKANLLTLVNKQIHVWNNVDSKGRLAGMNEIYQRDVLFFDHEGIADGIKDLNDRITALQHKFSGFKFSLAKIDNSYNVVRYYWNFGPASDPKLIQGMDLIILEKGKIRSLHVFLDKVPK